MEKDKLANLLPRIVLVSFCLCLSSFAADPTAVQSSHSASLRVRQHSDLALLEAKAQKAAAKALSATVSVQVGRGQGGGYAFGSGVIISADGYVVTAAHVASRPDQEVRFRLADGRSAEGVTLGLHKELDMGLMKITTAGSWPYLKRARSANVESGDWVLATGHPGGFDQKADALVRLGRVLKKTRKVILTDCTLVGGDSGGPLVDIEGNVIGVHSRIGADLTTNLHVPIDRFAENWDRLANKDVWGLMVTTQPWVGIDHNRSYTEARIHEIRSNSPAARAGLQPGDVVIRFADQDVRDFDQLKRYVSKQSPGSQVAIQFKRGDVLYETRMEIGRRRSSADSQTRDDAELLKDWLEQIDRQRRHGRAIVGIGKNADPVKESFHDVLDAASLATVEVLDDGTLVALGTIVDEDLIVTKASQLGGRELRCRFRNTRSFAVEKIAELRSHDLALLKSTRKLPSISMRSSPAPLPGSLLASSGLNAWPLAVGVVSSKVTKIRSEGKLGIRMSTNEPRVSALVAGSGADVAGVLLRDMITAVDDVSITTAAELIAIVRDRFPGDVLRLTVRRSGELIEIPVELLRYSEFDEALAEFEDFIGGALSKRRTGFDKAIQHDTAIQPVHCGGPVVDINGRFVGINIARAARTTSYLLPAAEVQLAVEKLKELSTDRLLTVDVRAATTADGK